MCGSAETPPGRRLSQLGRINWESRHLAGAARRDASPHLAAATERGPPGVAGFVAVMEAGRHAVTLFS